jgi:hypothetical protein
MKISRNTLCPCGSGKKYKRCCGADIQSHDDQSQGTPHEQLVEKIKSSNVSSIDEANDIADDSYKSHNEQSVKDFLGLSPDQMRNILHYQWSSPDLVTFNKNWFPKNSRALSIFDAFISNIGEKGLETTDKGNLPIKLCRDIYDQFPDDIYDLRGNIRTELELDELHTIRVLSQMAGIIKYRHKYFSLTEKGKKLLNPEKRALLFRTLIETYVEKFSWGYRDGYGKAHIVQNAWLFSLYLLSIFGGKFRSSGFYVEKFVRAFPMAVDEFNDTSWREQKDYLQRCYESRTLNLFAEFWGFIETDRPKNRGLTISEFNLKAINLSEWLSFHA